MATLLACMVCGAAGAFGMAILAGRSYEKGFKDAMRSWEIKSLEGDTE